MTGGTDFVVSGCCVVRVVGRRRDASCARLCDEREGGQSVSVRLRAAGEKDNRTNSWLERGYN